MYLDIVYLYILINSLTRVALRYTLIPYLFQIY